jgi:hypothetical protein
METLVSQTELNTFQLEAIKKAELAAVAKFAELNRKEQVKNKIIAIRELTSKGLEVPQSLKESLKLIAKDSDFTSEMIVIARNTDGTIKYKNLVKYIGTGFEMLKETFEAGENNAKFQKMTFGLFIDKFDLDFSKVFKGFEVLISEKTLITTNKGKETEKELKASLLFHRLKTQIIDKRSKLLAGQNSSSLMTNILNAKIDISANKKALKTTQD